jgi:SAM-dependent methyltransferase
MGIGVSSAGSVSVSRIRRLLECLPRVRYVLSVGDVDPDVRLVRRCERAMADSLPEQTADSVHLDEHELAELQPGVVDLAPGWSAIPWHEGPPASDVETLDDDELEAVDEGSTDTTGAGVQTLRVAKPTQTSATPPQVPSGRRRQSTGALPPPMPAAATGAHAVVPDDDARSRLPAGNGFQTGPTLPPPTTQRMRPRDRAIVDEYDLGAPVTTQTAPAERRPARPATGRARTGNTGSVTAVPPAIPASTSPTPDDDVGAFMAEIMASDKAESRASSAPSVRQTSRSWYREVFDETWFKLLPDRLWPRTAREVQFIQDALGFAAGAELLDLACGFGRHALELADRGYRVTGVDLSRTLLERGAAEARRRSLDVAFMLGDMRELAFEAAFDGVICMQTSFGYFDDRTNFEVLQAVARALRPGGRVLIEVVNRDFIANHVPRRIWWDTDEVLLMEEVYFDWHVSRLRVHRSIVDQGREPWEQTMTTRMYSAHELTGLLQMCGLEVREISGEFAHRGTFLGPTNRHIIIVAERPR